LVRLSKTLLNISLIFRIHNRILAYWNSLWSMWQKHIHRFQFSNNRKLIINLMISGMGLCVNSGHQIKKCSTINNGNRNSGNYFWK
jgi:hypothetical protein